MSNGSWGTHRSEGDEWMGRRLITQGEGIASSQSKKHSRYMNPKFVASEHAHTVILDR
uniref:Uncharacterized protein n=1 Tax=Parascaris equorum TaxID=6256 RepID=A0A914RJV3_PAREQ